MYFPDDFVEKLKSSKNILFFTGAGISAESGISTFRGTGGIWNKLKPEELANFDAFIRNPNMVWEWYQYRRKIVNESKPNAGHTAIAELENYFDVTVVTQNVDNLHGRAGSSNILELHGNIERNFCIDCKAFYNTHDFNFPQKQVPECKKCGGLIRPDIVWFGEMLPPGVFEDAEEAASNSDMCFIIGTSAVVYPAAYIPITAKQNGSYLVEINIEPTEISNSVDLCFTGKSGDILPRILDLIKE